MARNSLQLAASSFLTAQRCCCCGWISLLSLHTMKKIWVVLNFCQWWIQLCKCSCRFEANHKFSFPNCRSSGMAMLNPKKPPQVFRVGSTLQPHQRHVIQTQPPECHQHLSLQPFGCTVESLGVQSAFPSLCPLGDLSTRVLLGYLLTPEFWVLSVRYKPFIGLTIWKYFLLLYSLSFHSLNILTVFHFSKAQSIHFWKGLCFWCHVCSKG